MKTRQQRWRWWLQQGWSLLRVAVPLHRVLLLAAAHPRRVEALAGIAAGTPAVRTAACTPHIAAAVAAAPVGTPALAAGAHGASCNMLPIHQCCPTPPSLHRQDRGVRAVPRRGGGEAAEQSLASYPAASRGRPATRHLNLGLPTIDGWRKQQLISLPRDDRAAAKFCARRSRLVPVGAAVRTQFPLLREAAPADCHLLGAR